MTESSRTRTPLYFDFNSTAPVDRRVLQRFNEVELAYPANPDSLHAAGRLARSVLEDARDQVAAAMGVGRDGVIFLSGGTEANNWVVQNLGDRTLPVWMSEIEHPSVREAAGERGVVRCAVGADGCVEVDDPPRPIGLCCVVHGQNETGAIQPVAAVAELARRLQVPLHVDASQTLGRIDLAELPGIADSVTLSGHKVGGLRGCSVLLVTGSERPEPLLRGGGQEGGLRPGTSSPALAAATALAIRLACDEREHRALQMRLVRDRFVANLHQSLGELRCLTPNSGLPNTAMIEFEGVDGRSLLPALDLAAVQASQGSACSAGSPEPPRVLLEMGLSADAARRCVRFSFSYETSQAMVDDGARRVTEVVTRLRDVARSKSLREPC